jgi:hypothetical protein
MSETKFEAQMELILQAQLSGLSREAEDNATSRGLLRIHPPAEAGGF